jgi:hypothetical protein
VPKSELQLDIPFNSQQDGVMKIYFLHNRNAANPIFLNWTRLILFAAICMAQPAVLFAADEAPVVKYKPAFDIQLNASTSAIVAAYLKANRSSTPEIAVKRWKAFLSEYAEDENIEDMTDLTLIRQANFELMRLYYQKGQFVEADKLLKKVADYTVYSMPEPAMGKEWCRSNNFCN